MRRKILLLALLVCISFAAFTAAAFKDKPVKSTIKSETCTQWDGTGIQFRWCETDWGLRSHQFYNGYRFNVHFFYYLEYTDGTNSGNNGNIYLDAESYSDKASNDNASGTNKKVQAWKISKKERKDATGKWVQF